MFRRGSRVGAWVPVALHLPAALPERKLELQTEHQMMLEHRPQAHGRKTEESSFEWYV